MFPSEKDFVIGDPQIMEGLKTQQPYTPNDELIIREYSNPKISVCALIYGPNGGIIAVSRRDDHEAFGLIGGKVDEGETVLEALYRETFEETGLKILTNERIFQRVDGEYISFTYLCTAEGEINTDNEIGNAKGVVKEVSWDVLFNGPFGDYNRELYKFINNE